MLKIDEVSFFLGNKQLYDKCSIFIKPNDKIGLIGPNGAGKSTLLKLITGELKPDSGSVVFQKDVTFGYLNQELLSCSSKETIKNVVMESFSHIIELKKDLEEIVKKMETDYDEQLCEKMIKIQEEIENLDGYEIESKAEKILEEMEFTTNDLNRPLNEFSGGWIMRVMLAKTILKKPSLLMLDEPTNHLDIESIKWLEKYLINYNGAFMLISHDRYFLDKVTNRIIELDKKKLVSYPGNYSFYENEKAKNQEIQQHAYENQQKERDRMQTFINKFGAKNTKAKQAQSIEKRMNKMEVIEPVNNKIAKIKFNFDIKQQSGKIVATLEDIEKKYSDVVILKKSSKIIKQRDKIALIGANGKGKSTLLKMIFHSDPENENYEKLEYGKIDIGRNVSMAFYEQHQTNSLNLENNILQELIPMNSKKTEQDIRKICGMFLFSKDDIYKKIKVLSGGEKARIALIKVLLTEANFLLLDEPTNHLDMISIDILGQAIQQYAGTCIAVSHDRHFVSQIANKIWYIEDELLKEYPGTYEEFINFEKNHPLKKKHLKKKINCLERT